MSKQKTREKCSFNEGHERPSFRTYQDDLYTYYKEYACRGEYKSINDVTSAISRLRDYLKEPCEYNPHGFPTDLRDKDRTIIISNMLWKMQNALESF